MQFEHIGLVVVLYHPDDRLVIRNLEQLRKQVGIVYLVDNTPDLVNDKLAAYATDNVHYVPLKQNLGIAAAQNVGMKEIFAAGMDYVLLMDQDSEPDTDMIPQLYKAYQSLQAKGITKISAIGPVAINKDTDKVYKDRELSKDYVVDRILKKTDIMSSGKLISKAAYEVIGGMEEALFIDGVDSEWCWRGAVKGYTCFVNEDALLKHKLGEGDTKFLGLTFATPPPIRCFYQYRNFLILIRRNYTPFSWKALNFVKYLVKLVYYPIVLNNKKKYLQQIFKGIKAGIRYREN